jgi:hypothetical protein
VLSFSCRHCHFLLSLRKLRLCRVFQALPSAIYRALSTDSLCREPHSAKQHSRCCYLCRASGRRHVGTLGRIQSLPRVCSRQSRHPRRRSEHVDIWVAVHFVEGSAVGPSAKTLFFAEGRGPALGNDVDDWFITVDWPLLRVEWSCRQSTLLCRRPTLGNHAFVECPKLLILFFIFG